MSQFNRAKIWRLLLSLLAVAVFIAPMASEAWPRSETGYAGTRPDEAARLRQIADEHAEHRQRLFLLVAAENKRDALRQSTLGLDILPAQREEKMRVFTKIMTRAKALDKSQLSKGDIVTYDALIHDLTTCMDALKLQHHPPSISPTSGDTSKLAK